MTFPYTPRRIYPCPCGSAHPSHWAHDARGIPLARVCEKCEATRLAAYRPEVLTNPDYDHEEPIDPD